LLVVCVYCSEEKDFVRGERHGAFNSEHVVPESFAKVENSPTLIGIVCRSCNDYFGKTLDQSLARGSGEALGRFVEKQKDACKIKELSRKKLRISLDKADDPSIRKAKVDLTHHEGEVKQQFATQLCIKLKTGEWEVVQRCDFQEFIAKNPEVDLSDFKILGPKSEGEEFFAEICAVWPGLRITGDLGNQEYISDVIIDYGPIEMRALAKIAFNYFCYITQDQPTLARSLEFDPIRRFIRYGDTPPWAAVTFNRSPILTGDTITRRRTRGHLVTFSVERNPSTRKNEAASLVSLFNNLTWKVVLHPNFFKEVRARIHRWNWDAEKPICEEQIARKVYFCPALQPGRLIFTAPIAATLPLVSY